MRRKFVLLAIFFLFVFGACEKEEYIKPNLIKGPFLRHLTQNEAIIVWTVDAKGKVKARYGKGTSLNFTWKGETTSQEVNELKFVIVARLTDLEPDTEYSFSPDVQNPITISFKTFPQGLTALHFAVFGDNRTGLAKFETIVSLIENENPDVVFHTGDMVEFGSLYYGHGLVGWDDFLNTISPLYQTTPLYVAFGNHDRGGEDVYSAVFPPISDEVSPYFYSFELAGIRFILLNSEGDLSSSSDQALFLNSDLENSSADFKIVFIHRPPYSSGYHGKEAEEGKEEEIIRLRENFVPLFEKYGVDIVFAGHEHNYERTYPVKNGSVSQDGVVYVITGGGGAPLYDMEIESPLTYTFVKAYNYVMVDKIGAELRITAKDEEGRVIDQFELQR